MSVGSEARPAVDAPTGMGQGPAAARAGSFAWFARHEIRLALRDWARPGAEWRVAATAVVIAAALHLCAYGAIGLLPLGDDEDAPSRLGLDLIISFGLVSLFAMMVAQAMEAVTRAFYVRGDLELILSSPASVRRLFAVRMAATTLTSLSLVGFLILPFVNMLAVMDNWGWLGSYGVLLAMAALAQALALAITVGLFRSIGPKRTRVTAQVVGAVLGATAVIGGQVPAILKSGTLSRLSWLEDPAILAHLPRASSPLLRRPPRATRAQRDERPVLLMNSRMLIGSSICAACAATADSGAAACQPAGPADVLGLAGPAWTLPPAAAARRWLLLLRPQRVCVPRSLRETDLYRRLPQACAHQMLSLSFL